MQARHLFALQTLPFEKHFERWHVRAVQGTCYVDVITGQLHEFLEQQTVQFWHAVFFPLLSAHPLQVITFRELMLAYHLTTMS
jgi:hypothetical protein